MARAFDVSKSLQEERTICGWSVSRISYRQPGEVSGWTGQAGGTAGADFQPEDREGAGFQPRDRTGAGFQPGDRTGAGFQPGNRAGADFQLSSPVPGPVFPAHVQPGALLMETFPEAAVAVGSTWTSRNSGFVASCLSSCLCWGL